MADSHEVSNAIAPRCLSRLDAAAYVGHTPTTFDRLVKEGVLPGPVKLAARKRVWDIRNIDEAIDRSGKSSNDALSEHDLDVGLGLADH